MIYGRVLHLCRLAGKSTNIHSLRLSEWSSNESSRRLDKMLLQVTGRSQRTCSRFLLWITIFLKSSHWKIWDWKECSDTTNSQNVTQHNGLAVETVQDAVVMHWLRSIYFSCSTAWSLCSSSKEGVLSDRARSTGSVYCPELSNLPRPASMKTKCHWQHKFIMHNIDIAGFWSIHSQLSYYGCFGKSQI